MNGFETSVVMARSEIPSFYDEVDGVIDMQRDISVEEYPFRLFLQKAVAGNSQIYFFNLLDETNGNEKQLCHRFRDLMELFN